MEYVIVEFHEDRVVLIDDQENGRTNESLRLGPGTHTFSLGGLQNYTPKTITCVIAGTSILDPKMISFGEDND